MALLAKKSGRSISFGEIKSPEFKARLMLACLENDVKMKNIPTFTELKDIEPTTMKQINDKLKEISNKEKGATQETNTQGSQQATTRKPTVAQILNSKGFGR